MTLRLRAAALSLALCLAPAAARADISDADRATARALAFEGQDALDRRDYAVAYDRFSRADAILHAPTLLIGAARALVGLGRWVEAQEAYGRIVREGVPAGAPEQFSLAIEEARRELQALTPRIPSVTVVVKGPSSATVTIDNAPIPAAAIGARRPADPGEHVIRASAPGHTSGEAKVTLAEGANETVTLELQPAAAPDGAGGSPGGAPDQVSAGGGSSRKTLAFVALGVGGAGLILGGVTGALALGKHGELEDACTLGNGTGCPPAQQDNLDSYHTMGTLSTIGFIAGGVGVTAGVVLLVTAPSSAPAQAQRGAWIAPRVGLGYVGAEGRF